MIKKKQYLGLLSNILSTEDVAGYFYKYTTVLLKYYKW